MKDDEMKSDYFLTQLARYLQLFFVFAYFKLVSNIMLIIGRVSLHWHAMAWQDDFCFLTSVNAVSKKICNLGVNPFSKISGNSSDLVWVVGSVP